MKKEKKYAVFVEIEEDHSDLGTSKFQRIRGYLESLIDEKIISKNIIDAEIWKPEDFDLWFYKDLNIKEKVLSLENLPKRYYLSRMEIIDQGKFLKKAKKICERFKLQYFIYAKQSGND